MSPRSRSTSFLGRILLVGLLLGGCNSTPPSSEPNVMIPMPSPGLDSTLESQRTPDSDIKAAFDNNTSNLQVLVRGIVTKHLSDDVSGDKHQRFIVRLDNGQTLLIAHNIDLATRVPSSSTGKTVYVYGEYEWNAEGGVVHWTHHDPAGTHVDGWIQFEGVRYQ